MFTKRIDSLRSQFNKEGIDAFYSSDKYNVRYFTGKPGDDCSILITETEAYLISDFRYREVMQNTPGFVFYEGSSENLIKNLHIERLGFELNNISLSEYNRLKSCTKNPVLIENLVENLRMIKDEDEIQKILMAEQLGCKAFDYALSILKPGISEKKLALEINNYMMLNGAEGLSFDTIAISAEKTSMPHGIPSDRIIENNSFVLMDFGCILDGYCSDMTRTVALGHVSDKMKDVYNIVLEAQLTACENIKSGIDGITAHNYAADVIKNAGYAECFGHSLGHGVGLKVHELPLFSPRYDSIIPENSVVSIEPGIYLPGEFGVRIEDLAIIKTDGIINSTLRASKDLITI